MSFKAPRAAVYRPLLDPRPIEKWKVPDGMSCRVHYFDARVGGEFRISLTYDRPTGTGKTTARTDTYRGRFDHRAMFARYVHFPNPLYYDAAALWTLHTHVCHHFKHTPRLHLRSNIEGEGKSTVFDVLEPLVANARRSDNTTGAAVMREADERPIKTLQLDEADNLNLMTDPTFRAVLNSGYSRQGRRTIVVNGIATTYRLFAPIALAGIASLPSPLMRRSIIFDITRASRDELKTLMEIDDQDPVQKEEFDIVHAAITHWAHHVREQYIRPLCTVK